MCPFAKHYSSSGMKICKKNVATEIKFTKQLRCVQYLSLHVPTEGGPEKFHSEALFTATHVQFGSVALLGKFQVGYVESAINNC